MKKGQGLSLNVIIVAILVLIVLVVLALVFTGKLRGFGKDTEAAQQQFKFGNCGIPGTGTVCQSSGCGIGLSAVGDCPSGQTCCKEQSLL